MSGMEAMVILAICVLISISLSAFVLVAARPRS